MTEIHTEPRRRGRPPKRQADAFDTRDALVRCGMATLTEKGFSATGIDEVLKKVGVPKGSFYHYFESKEAFGHAAIAAYAAYFARKLDRWLLAADRPALLRIADFVDDAAAGIARHDFRRGCLIGNLGQEMSALPESYRDRLEAVFADWQARLARCLRAAQAEGALAPEIDCEHWAAFFWVGWEGAVLRARLKRSVEPLHCFADGFFTALGR
ncbi:MAG: TetR/AcrR family transcriptional regulator [Rhodocyclaceae bacterium]|nr:TetR/AcrR family transcriptional regulator [Rhodocyclaceae bacterium]